MTREQCAESVDNAYDWALAVLADKKHRIILLYCAVRIRWLAQYYGDPVEAYDAIKAEVETWRKRVQREPSEGMIFAIEQMSVALGLTLAGLPTD